MEIKNKKKNLKDNSIYYCTCCGINTVDAQNGYDTCSSCLNKQ